MNNWIPIGLVLSVVAFSPLRGEDLQNTFERVERAAVLVQAQEAGVVNGSSATIAPEIVHGAGVYIADEQRVTTSAELVQAADWVEVSFSGLPPISAGIQSSSVLSDVAVLELEAIPTPIPSVALADSDKVHVGDAVFIVTLTSSSARRMLVGKIIDRRLPGKVNDDLVQDEFFEIDIAVTPADSGAPVFNAAGNVIGIISHTMSLAAGYEGLGFAVPSNLVKGLVKSRSFWTGVSGQLLSGSLAERFNLPQEKGLLVERVARTSLAEKFGLRGGTRSVVMEGKIMLVGGDILLSVDGISFSESDSLNKIAARLRSRSASDIFYIDLLRDGKPMRISSSIGQ